MSASTSNAPTLDLRLHKKQGVAFLSEAVEILYGGAAGGGKSHLMRASAIFWCCSIPGLQVYLFRRTFPDLFANHMEGPTGFPAMLAAYVLAGLVEINYSRGEIRFWNGAKIHLCHCQHEKDVYKYQGAEMHVLIIDELTQWLKSMYTFLRSRVRLGGLSVPAQFKGLFPRILSGANPGGIGHTWVKMMFVDFGPPLELKKAEKKDGGMLRQYIPARLEDNPTLLENDPEYEARLEGLGTPALVRAMRLGDWDIVAGGMFDDVWDRERHVIEPFDIPSSWRINRSFDWGSSKPFSVCWWAESNGEALPDGRCWPRGTVFLIDEWYGCVEGEANVGIRMLSEEIAAGIKEREAINPILHKPGPLQPGTKKPLSRVRGGPADSAIWNAEDGPSIADKMESKGVCWEKANKSPGSRIQGWEEIRTRFKAGLQSPMEAPGLFFFKHCPHAIRTLPVLPRDSKKPDDADTNAEDHFADAARYRLWTGGPIAVG